MSPTTIFIIGIVAAGILLVLGVMTIAYRRGDSAQAITGDFDKRALKADKAATKAKQAGGSAVAVMAPPDAEEEATPAPPPTDPLDLREELTPAEMGWLRYADQRRQHR
jgi:hypothetical protein